MKFEFWGGSFKNHEYYTTYVTFCKVFLIFLSFGSIFTPRFYAICTISLYVSSNSPFFWRNPHFGEKCCEIYVLKWFSHLFLRSAFGTSWGKTLYPAFLPPARFSAQGHKPPFASASRRRIYPRHLRPCNAEDEAGKPSPDGAIYSRCEPIKENNPLDSHNPNFISYETR